MAKLQDEYIDVKSIKHHVEHIMLSTEDNTYKERILEELTHALTKTGGISA